MALRYDRDRPWNPRPRVSNAEDAQPNEQRMLPKGSGVPAIKPSHRTRNPHGARYHFSSPQRHRGSYHVLSSPVAGRPWASAYSPGTSFDPRSQPTKSTAPVGGYVSPRLPFKPEFRSSEVISPDQHSSAGQKRKLEDISTVKQEPDDHSPRNENHKKMRTDPESIVLLFPPYVRSARSRKEYAMKEKDKFAKGRNVEVIRHQYLPNGIEIFFRPIPLTDDVRPLLSNAVDAKDLAVACGSVSTPFPVNSASNEPTSPMENMEHLTLSVVANASPSCAPVPSNKVKLEARATPPPACVKVERMGTSALLLPTRLSELGTSTSPTSTKVQSSPLGTTAQDARQSSTISKGNKPAPAVLPSLSPRAKNETPVRAFKSGTLRFKRFGSSSASPTPKRPKPTAQVIECNSVHVMPPPTSSTSPETIRTGASSTQPERMGTMIDDVFNRNGSLDEDLAQELLPSDRSNDTTPRFSEDGETFLLPKGSNDKPRRILTTPSMIIVTSMHGRVHEISGLPRKYQRQLKFENLSKPTRSDDSCVLAPPHDTVIVITRHGDPDAIAPYVPLTLYDISRERSSKSITDAKDHVTSITAVHALPRSLRFVTGGVERNKHCVRLWEVNRDLSLNSSTQLEIKHTASIRAILPTGSSGTKLLTGGDDRIVNAYDLSAERPFLTHVNCSNKIHHLHPTSEHDSILVEVQHRDSQFEIHDLRAFSSKIKPEVRFGYEATGKRANAAAAKGDIRGKTFVFGDDCGIVRAWDLRNTKSVAQQLECFWGPQIVHVKFDDKVLAVCSSDSQIKFLNIDRPECSL